MPSKPKKITPKTNCHTIMGIFAHPDDETFGPGATLAKYARQGHNIVIISTTRGQAGQSSNQVIKKDLAYHREQEIRRASKILGITHLHLLDFFDGSLNQHQLPLLKNLIKQQIDHHNPEVIIVFEPGGISWHLDHIAVTKGVIELFDENKICPQKIYYFGFSKPLMKKLGREGGLPKEKSATIDVTNTWPTKVRAMKKHCSQEKDWQRIIKELTSIHRQHGTYEYFSLARTTLKNLKFPEKDLLAGL